LAIALPLLSLGAYQWLGQPQALEPRTLAQGMPNEHLTPERLEGMAKALRERLQQNPDQAEDWVMLARVERALDHYDAAAQALASALKLSQDLDWAIERAEILATARQGDFQGEPWQIITSVLKTDPQHLGALLLAGSASYSEGRYPQALKHWEQASALVPADAPDRQPLDAALSQVRSKLGLPDPRAQAMAASAVRGRVSLAPSARERVQANDTVFIYATAPDSRMPLAIEQIKAAQLPYDFVLDDSKAMNPQVHLSDATVLVVRARVSRSGQAQAQPQDLSAELTGVRPGTKGLQLILK
jgi:cytochrome c-type biogenesis protein CcmH